MTELKIYELGYQRITSFPKRGQVFNPTIYQNGTLASYDYDKYISQDIIEPFRKKEVKYKFVSHNSTIKASGFYFNEVTSIAYTSDVTNSLFRMYEGPFKRLELSNCLFDLIN
jgi:hypothetical protein